MEIDITILKEQDCQILSGSIAELGENAGPYTWNNNLELAEEYPLVTDANRQEIRDHFGEYGAWDDEEIANWSDQELAALVLQEGAAEMREFEELCEGDWAEYDRLSSEGQISGRLSQGSDGKIYIYIGM